MRTLFPNVSTGFLFCSLPLITFLFLQPNQCLAKTPPMGDTHPMIPATPKPGLPSATSSPSNPNAFCPSYEAEYRVYWHGVYSGEAHHRVSLSSEQVCRAESSIKPRFRFLPFEYQEFSDFIGKSNNIYPIAFDFDWHEKREHTHGQIRFDWTNTKVKQNTSFSHETLKLEPGTQDKISLVFQLRQNLMQAKTLKPGLTWSFPVVEPKKHQHYQFTVLKTETLRTPLGKLKTVVVNQTAENSARHSLLWFAIDRDYLLVKALQYKDEAILTESVIHRLWDERED